MLQTRVIPCLLIQNRKLVKTVKFKNAKYVGDPVNAIKIYNEKEVDELVILDISATVENRKPDFTMISEITDECFMPLAYGGGITTVEDMKKIFSLGVEKVILNSFALENPQILTEAAKIFGNQSIVVSIDVKKNIFGKYVVCTQSGTKKVKIDPVQWAKQAQEAGAGEIMLTAIDRDGTWEGYDLTLVQSIAKEVTVPIIACGGAGSVEDFTKVVKSGASAVAAGSMVVYQGKDLGVLINFPARDKLEKALH